MFTSEERSLLWVFPPVVFLFLSIFRKNTCCFSFKQNVLKFFWRHCDFVKGSLWYIVSHLLLLRLAYSKTCCCPQAGLCLASWASLFMFVLLLQFRVTHLIFGLHLQSQIYIRKLISTGPYKDIFKDMTWSNNGDGITECGLLSSFSVSETC